MQRGLRTSGPDDTTRRLQREYSRALARRQGFLFDRLPGSDYLHRLALQDNSAIAMFSRSNIAGLCRPLELMFTRYMVTHPRPRARDSDGPGGTFELNVVTLSRQCAVLRVAGTDTVAAIKQKISDRGWAGDLYANETHLVDDDALIQDCSIPINVHGTPYVHLLPFDPDAGHLKCRAWDIEELRAKHTDNSRLCGHSINI